MCILLIEKIYILPMFTVEQLPAPEGFENVTPEEQYSFIRMFFFDYYYDYYFLSDEYSPLFDYVDKWANKFCPSYDPEEEQIMPSEIPFIFVRRYLCGMIPNVEEIKTEYENSEELLNTLDAYDIDKSKYFYLCLMLKDYIDGFNDALKIQLSHIDVIKEFIDKLDEMIPDKNLWSLGKAEHGAELTLKVDGVKGVFKTTNKVLINTINFCISEFYHKYKDKNTELNYAPFDFNDRKSISKTEKAFLFCKYLDWFLEDKKYVGRALDRSKWLLKSRSYYVFEISENLDKDKYYTYYNGINTLRDLIKKCKDPSKKVHNNFNMSLL